MHADSAVNGAVSLWFKRDISERFTGDTDDCREAVFFFCSGFGLSQDPAVMTSCRVVFELVGLEKILFFNTK